MTREEKRAYGRAYYHANRERMMATSAAWKAANKERVVESSRGYRQQKPEKKATYQRWRRVQEKGTVDYVAVRARNGMVCGICRKPIQGAFHYDHIISLFKGGPHTTENLQLAHPRCNYQKGVN